MLPVADNAAELPYLAHAELWPVPASDHRVGNPAGIPEDFAFLRDAVRDWLDRWHIRGGAAP